MLYRPHPQNRFSNFSHSRCYRIFSKGNNSIQHFYSQTEMMFAWQFLAALSVKGEAMQVASSLAPSGSCLQAPLLQGGFWASPETKGFVPHKTVWRPRWTCRTAQTWVYSGQLLSGSPASWCTILFQSGSLHWPYKLFWYTSQAGFLVFILTYTSSCF